MATRPRPVLPGKTYHVVSRCDDRAFRLVPKKGVNEILLYCLAVAAQRSGVEVHEFCFMSNHIHLMVTDVRGDLPKFMNRLGSLASRCLNALRGRRGSNFEGDYVRVEQLSTSTAMETCAYILANPPRADLVVRGRHWRGLTSVSMRYGDQLTVPRPRLGIWKNAETRNGTQRRRRKAVAPGRARRAGRSRLPAVVEFELKPPPLPSGGSGIEMRQDILKRLEAKERAAEAERAAAGRKVLGMRRVLQQDWNDRPRSREDLLGPVPTASGCRWKKREHAMHNAAFVADHAEARRQVIEGKRPLFPAGTWLMVRRYGYACASP